MTTRSIITPFEINERETAKQFIRALEKSRNEVMKGQEKTGNINIKVKELKGKEIREFFGLQESQFVWKILTLYVEFYIIRLTEGFRKEVCYIDGRIKLL